MILHADSHLDHNIPPVVVNHVLETYKDRSEFFLVTFDLPHYLPSLECGLYGPTMGDGYIPEEEVEYSPRGSRPYASRLTDKPKRPTRQCTVIGGPHKGEPCVLYTIFGGPSTPKEPGDFPDDMPQEQRDAALLFWARHALAK